ncbi:hypothetical protein LAU_0306 [Lausannevirus]|uniref:Uncharacterized protein n=1 Tax=Lausannevirus TaxID=999883 RepID=F2WLN4_9VIRU|nr:hypothetical protein LAU_0306 [Lausannevirus]AEA07157.1 hypothetical protein LAU_0306 [Lausannevirus]
MHSHTFQSSYILSERNDDELLPFFFRETSSHFKKNICIFFLFNITKIFFQTEQKYFQKVLGGGGKKHVSVITLEDTEGRFGLISPLKKTRLIRIS